MTQNEVVKERRNIVWWSWIKRILKVRVFKKMCIKNTFAVSFNSVCYFYIKLKWVSATFFSIMDTSKKSHILACL